MLLNQRTREQLILLVSSGKNTYTDIKQAIPELTDDELRIASLPMLINDLSERVLSLDHLPSGDKYSYKFADDDKFSLSWYGEDLLYKVQKELRQKRFAAVAADEAEKARRVAEKSLLFSAIAAICAVISILIALLQLR